MRYLLSALLVGLLILPASAETDRRCSVFTVARDGEVFFGGNDDYVNPDSWFWVDPGGGRRHGVIWIGRPDNVQQGVNERGLAYDANGLPRVDVNPHAERAPVAGSYTSYPIHILRECATVEEVLVWVETHRWHDFMHDQMHFADATGDAVILGAGPDGELAVTRKEPGNGFLVSTNFNVARPSNGFSDPCWRYDRARELLGDLLEGEAPLNAEAAASVLEAVHVEDAGGWTLESLVADLTRGKLYLYYFHQFHRPLVLDLAEELARPREACALSELFPDEVAEEGRRRHEAILARSRHCRRFGAAWLVAVALSLALSAARRPRRLWIPLALILGPWAFLAGLLARGEGKGRAALTEAAAGAAPTALAFLAALLLVIYAAPFRGNPAMQAAAMLSLPLLAGWLFAALLLRGGGDFLARRLPQCLVAALLGMAGISLPAIPLINRSLRSCTIMPPWAWTFVTWWGLIALSALAGILVLYLYERWALGRGFAAWSRPDDPSTPGWRRLWWWIPLGIVALAAGIAGSQVLQGMMQE